MDIKNQRFNRLVALEIVGKNNDRANVWRCICDCGNETNTSASRLRSGHTKSCGCLRKEKAVLAQKQNCYIHGFRRTPFYKSWSSMKERCNNRNSIAFTNYGGRGIRVCERWLSFENFMQDMYESYQLHVQVFGLKNTTLERVDVNKNYNKQNCRWATNEEQSRNRRNNVLLTFNKKTQCMAAWADEVNIGASVIYKRLKRGWSVEKALTTPVKGS